jgi:hypothetical protein
MARKLASFSGSWTFVVIFASVLLLNLYYNTCRGNTPPFTRICLESIPQILAEAAFFIANSIDLTTNLNS